MKNIISISPRVSKILLIVIVLLTVASVAASFWEQIPADKYLVVEIRESFIRLFNPNGEANIISWYSSSALLLSSVLLGIIALAKKMNHDSYTLQWGILSLIFYTYLLMKRL